MNRHFYKMLIALFLASAQTAWAAEPMNHFIGQYDFSWSGFRLGWLALEVDENDKAYSMRLKVESAGLVNLFTHHTDDTVVKGARSGQIYHPELYESHYQTKNKPRYIKLMFNKKGVVTEEINEPPEDRTLRPEVPHALKDGAYDPLTLMMALRNGATESRSFDAKHLFAVHSAHEAGAEPVTFGKYSVTGYTLSRTPLAGITQKEAQSYAKGEPPLTLYLSADARQIPVGVSIPFLLSHIRGILVKECATWDACVK